MIQIVVMNTVLPLQSTTKQTEKLPAEMYEAIRMPLKKELAPENYSLCPPGRKAYQRHFKGLAGMNCRQPKSK